MYHLILSTIIIKTTIIVLITCFHYLDIIDKKIYDRFCRVGSHFAIVQFGCISKTVCLTIVHHSDLYFQQ